MGTRVSITVVALLALGGLACADSTTEVESQPAGGTVAESDSLVSWELGSSLTGELEQVVSWSEGFAAIMDTDGGETPGGGELWYSEDGVEWWAAVVRPLGRTTDIYALAAQGDQLFALSGDIFDRAAPRTLWRRQSGEPWVEVITDVALQGIAVNSDRVIAYAWDRFEIVGVFDTATMEPVEFAGLPEVVSAEGVSLGRVMALDEGFLATVGRPSGIGADQPDWTSLHSADGSDWNEHPSPPPGGVGIPSDQATAPMFEGRNLVASFSLSWPPPGDAWVTDTGIEFESVPDPVSDRVSGVAPAHLVELTNGTDAGFLAVVKGVIHQSLDGVDWHTIESPPTWSELAEIDRRGLVHGTMLATEDSLIAVGVHGGLEGWVGLVNPTTDIWVTER